MRQLTDVEYRDLNFFKIFQAYSPSQELKSYKRNVIVFGSLVVFFYFAQIKIAAFHGIFIEGVIGRPYLVPVFLILYFLYNFYMFNLYFKKEVDLHDININNVKGVGDK